MGEYTEATQVFCQVVTKHFCVLKLLQQRRVKFCNDLTDPAQMSFNFLKHGIHKHWTAKDLVKSSWFTVPEPTKTKEKKKERREEIIYAHQMTNCLACSVGTHPHPTREVQSFDMGRTKSKLKPWEVRNHTHNASQHHSYCLLRLLKDIWILKAWKAKPLLSASTEGVFDSNLLKYKCWNLVVFNSKHRLQYPHFRTFAKALWWCGYFNSPKSYTF